MTCSGQAIQRRQTGKNTCHILYNGTYRLIPDLDLKAVIGRPMYIHLYEADLQRDMQRADKYQAVDKYMERQTEIQNRAAGVTRFSLPVFVESETSDLS